MTLLFVILSETKNLGGTPHFYIECALRADVSTALTLRYSAINANA